MCTVGVIVQANASGASKAIVVKSASDCRSWHSVGVKPCTYSIPELGRLFCISSRIKGGSLRSLTSLIQRTYERSDRRRLTRLRRIPLYRIRTSLAVIIHYRNRLGFAVINFKNYKQSALKNEPDYLHPVNAGSYGSNGVLMVSSNNSTAAAGDTQYEVVSISDPASSKPLATIPAVIQRVDREQTGTIFLLIDSALTIVRCLATEREHQIAAQQKNEN